MCAFLAIDLIQWPMMLVIWKTYPWVKYDTVSFSYLTILQTLFAVMHFSILTTYFSKLLVLLYFRIFSIKPIIGYLIYFGVAFNTCLALSVLIVTWQYCSPRPGAAWDLNLGWKCDHMKSNTVKLGAFNIALDLRNFFLTLSTILKLQLPLRRKIDLIVIFGTGIS